VLAVTRTRLVRALTIAVPLGVLLGVLAQAHQADLPGARSVSTRERAVVRVLHFGDSHTGSQEMQATLRETLRARSGEGGPGFVFPWTVGPRPVEAGRSSGWRHIALLTSHTEEAPIVGLRGVALEATRNGERAWLETDATQIRVHFLRQPGGGLVALRVGGNVVGSADLDGPEPETRTLSWGTSGRARTKQVEIVTLSAGAVRILGVSLEHAFGAVYSPLWVNGAQAAWLLRLPTPVLAGLVRAESPDVLVLAFGTNEACSDAFDPVTYQQELQRLLVILREAAPCATFVLVGPPDAGETKARPENLAAVVEVQRGLARAWDAAFVDLRGVMGGAGSIHHWIETGLARKDEVHFTTHGYRRLAEAVVAPVLDGLGLIGGLPPTAMAGALPAPPARRRHSWASATPRAAQGSGLFLFKTTEGRFIMTDDPSRIAGQTGEWVGPQPEWAR
jgi:lysophospholipase L1-like esterase